MQKTLLTTWQNNTVMKPRKLVIKADIREYEKSISSLQKMKDIYDTDVNLCGAFASDMYKEINEQIKFCQECINNLNAELQKL
jgi:hypothetical protein